jgi:hypothetical protein
LVLRVGLGRWSQSSADGRASAGRASVLSRGRSGVSRPGVRWWRECGKGAALPEGGRDERGSTAGGGVGWPNGRGAEAGARARSGTTAGSDLQVEERARWDRQVTESKSGGAGCALVFFFCLGTHSSVGHAKADVNSSSSVGSVEADVNKGFFSWLGSADGIRIFCRSDKKKAKQQVFL